MPLYSDPGYFYSSGSSSSAYSNLYNPYTPYTSSYTSLSSYNRGYSNPYVMPPSTSRTGLTSSRYTPKLSTITESPMARGMMPLTRINSPKFLSTESNYQYTSPTNYQKYIPPRPILINTADIDVSASKFRNRCDFKSSPKNETKRSPTMVKTTKTISASESVPEEKPKPIKELSTNKIESTETPKPEPEIDRNRSTIRRNRPVVRLSTVRKSIRDRSVPSKKLKSDVEINEPSKPEKKKLTESTNEKKSSIESEANTDRKQSPKSWRDRFGDELQYKSNLPKKSPGELLLEKHIIPFKQEDENKELTESESFLIVDPISHTATIGVSNYPSFQDICEDISSDKIDDDLNAGELRRRVSLIQEQEIQILNQLQKSESGSFQLIHLERNVSEPDCNRSGAKRKSKKIKKIRHKITATVDIENSPKTPILQNELLVDEEKTPKTPSPPKFKFNVDEVQESHTVHRVLKLPKKKIVATVPEETKLHKKYEKMEAIPGLRNSPKKAKVTNITGKKPNQGTKSVIIEEKKNLSQDQESELKNLDTKENTHDILPSKNNELKIKQIDTVKKSESSSNIASPKLEEDKSLDMLKFTNSNDQFKFDDASIKKITDQDKKSSQITSPKTPFSPKLKKTETPATKKAESPSFARPKPIAKANKIQKSDSGEDFWTQIGSRETLYMTNRKKNIFDDLWQKSETLLENQSSDNVKNLDEIKSEINRQKTEELKQTDEIEASKETEGRRAHSNESALCDKKRGIYKNENTNNEPNNLKSPTKKEFNEEEKSKEAKYSSKSYLKNEVSDTSSTAIPEQQHKESSIVTKIDNTGLTAKSPEIKCKENNQLNNKSKEILNKNNIEEQKLSQAFSKPQFSHLQKRADIVAQNAELATIINKTETIKKDIPVLAKIESTSSMDKTLKDVKPKISSDFSDDKKLKSNPIPIDLKKNVKLPESPKIPETPKTPKKIIETPKTPITPKSAVPFSPLPDSPSTPKTPKKLNNSAPSTPKLKKKKSISSTSSSASSSTKKKSTSPKITKTSKENTEIPKEVNDSKQSKQTTEAKTKPKLPSPKEIKSKSSAANLTEKDNENKIKTDKSKNVSQPSYKKYLQEHKNKSQELVDEKNENLSSSNLSKFATVNNLNQCLLDVDAELDDYIPSDFEESSYDSYSSDTSDSMKKKHNKKKREEKQFNRHKVKLDHTKKLYVKDEPAPLHQLIATPRPLFRPEKLESDSESGSDESTDDSECESGTDSDESDELNPQKSAIIRMSTCSNDSGFEGGTAPSSPKRMLDCDVNCHKKCEKLTANLCGINQKLIVEALLSVRKGTHHEARDSPSTPPSYNPVFKLDSSFDEHDETSYTYAQFQKSGRITAPATSIPRFKKYAVEDFHFLTVLGKGSFGKVLLAELRNTDYYYAVKCLKKDVVLEDDDVECTLIERKVLALGTKHPYLCHLFCTFQTESHLFFVMEYLNGGDLMFHIQQSGRFSEPRARFYAAEIVSGLKFLHKKGIVYRDLKLDNVLLDFDGHVRIADFGMCKLQIYLDRTADSFCGTPDYMAPEIIKGESYNQNVDWWSFGVLLYEMLIGQSPFSGCDEEYLFWSICNEIPLYPLTLSLEATSLLKALLEKDSAKRIGSQYSPAGDICAHSFFNQIDWERLEKRDITPPFKPQVKHPLDTQYFDKTFTRERVRLTPIDKDILQSMDQAQFQGFSYTNPNATLE